MKLLLDENVPLPSVHVLRNAGHDAVSISELSPGVPDETVLNLAVLEQRVLVTFDRDHGQLIFRHKNPPPPAVLYLRFVPKYPTEPATILQSLLSSIGKEIFGYFFVVERKRCRRRKLPGE